MGISSYRDLIAWQLSMDAVEQVYTLTQMFPKQEIYGLTSQVQRAAVSIPSNIAEGHTRDSTKEFLYHLYHCAWLTVRIGNSASTISTLAVCK